MYRIDTLPRAERQLRTETLTERLRLLGCIELAHEASEEAPEYSLSVEAEDSERWRWRPRGMLDIDRRLQNYDLCL